MSANSEEPDPTVGKRPPAWELVIAYVDHIMPKADQPLLTTPAAGFMSLTREMFELARADMIERDAIGFAKYQVRLTSDNGRDHLVDAYQENLDFIVYVRAELDKLGIDPLDNWYEPQHANEKYVLMTMFIDGVKRAVSLRWLIERRKA